MKYRWLVYWLVVNIAYGWLIGTQVASIINTSSSYQSEIKTIRLYQSSTWLSSIRMILRLSDCLNHQQCIHLSERYKGVYVHLPLNEKVAGLNTVVSNFCKIRNPFPWLDPGIMELLSLVRWSQANRSTHVHIADVKDTNILAVLKLSNVKCNGQLL